MPDDRRMTTDRFYGGVSSRLENLRAMLRYVDQENPDRDGLTDWVIKNTQAGSKDAIGHHLAFLHSINLIELFDARYELDEYGNEYLRDNDPETLYKALNAGVNGFDVLLSELTKGPMTDEDVMDLLVSEFEEAEMSKPGPATRHREWLQVLGFVEREDGINRITEKGLEFTKQESNSIGETEAEVQRRKTELERELESEPRLTSETEQFTDARRRVRNQAFAELVKKVYDQTCAVCGSSRETPAGNPEVEAAHIYPKEYGGADDVRNGLALCKLHHWAFDSGWISLTDEYEIIVKEATDRTGYHEFKRLEDQTIHRPDEEQAEPYLKYLEKHRQIHGFNND